MSNLFHQKFTDMTDEQLVRGTAHGNDLQYAELMRRYMRAVYTFVAEHVPADKVESITEQTFYTFWKSVHRFGGEHKSRHWLFTIAKGLIKQSAEQKLLLPARTLQLPVLRRYPLKLGTVSLLELADRLRSPLVVLETWHQAVRARALPMLSQFQLQLQHSVQGLLQGKFRLQNKFKFRLSLNSYRV